jgi:hypothetical protein
MSHTFHIPVLGLGYSIDTPVKVAHFGISSVVSIVDDSLTERMRQYYSEKEGLPFHLITKTQADHRAKRITAYLNLLNELVEMNFQALKRQAFEEGTDLVKYFELLPDQSDLKKAYFEMLKEQDFAKKGELQQKLKSRLTKGAIDANIMSKVDKINTDKNGESLGDVFSDALASLRGFANSNLNSSLILSAGMNPRLYSYLENFSCFLPDSEGKLAKKVILKVSDFRSAFIQAKFLAKKGIWVSEFRIESGLNCGGHAFATDGFLLGPILEEFKQRKAEMLEELEVIYQKALETKGISCEPLNMRISVQGGIGTAEENNFLMDYYNLDATGWGSPFLLVPEVSNVDDKTLIDLVSATQDDFYVSDSSPLGVPFNNFRKSSMEKLRLERIAKGIPGSPCTKKYLVSNTEFTKEAICTASRKYQKLKIQQLKESDLSADDLKIAIDNVTEKICLCEGLTSASYIKDEILKPKENKAVAICPGPNIAYFSGVHSMEEMVKHIYGKINLLNTDSRPNMFINELKLYVTYLEKEIDINLRNLSDKKTKYLEKFSEQLKFGIAYYQNLIPQISNQTDTYLNKMYDQLKELEQEIIQKSNTAKRLVG